MSAYSRRGSDPLEQGFDRIVSAGRQFVDGVSGARPGSRPPARPAGRRSGSLPRLDELGRWVEDKLDWVLDDDEDWREPWQEPAASPAAARAPEPQRRRRPLEAISRRPSAVPHPIGVPEPMAAESAPPESAAAADWPDDDTFTLPRWQRAAAPGRLEPPRLESPGPGPERPGRPLPRSSRRRRP